MVAVEGRTDGNCHNSWTGQAAAFCKAYYRGSQIFFSNSLQHRVELINVDFSQQNVQIVLYILQFRVRVKRIYRYILHTLNHICPICILLL